MTLLLLFGGSGPPFFESLLATANRLRDDEPAVAVVTAHIAFEVATEQAFSRLLQHRGVGDLEESLVALLPDRTFMSRGTKDLWFALTNAKIATADGWKEYADSVAVRNRSVHGGGQRVTRDEADASIAAVERVMRYVADETARVAS